MSKTLEQLKKEIQVAADIADAAWVAYSAPKATYAAVWDAEANEATLAAAYTAYHKKLKEIENE